MFFRHKRLLSTLAFLAVFTFCPFTGLSAQSGETWSAWHDTEGEGHIQFRWKTTGENGVNVPACDYELRNLNSSDRQTYDSIVDYITSRGSGDTKPGPFLDSTYQQNHGGIYGCTRITGVVTKLRRK